MHFKFVTDLIPFFPAVGLIGQGRRNGFSIGGAKIIKKRAHEFFLKRIPLTQQR